MSRAPAPLLTLVAFAALATALGCRPVDLDNDFWTRAGPHEVSEEITGPDSAFYVYRPTELDANPPSPVVVFSVGTGASPTAYTALLTHWASHGFVVIAGDSGMQANGDQALAGLAWILDENTTAGSPFEGRLDTANVAASGHSQGGNACIHVALRDDRVTALLPLMPGRGTLDNAERADETMLSIPACYVCAERDGLVPPEWCDERFDGTPGEAWVGVAAGLRHNAVVGREVGRDNVAIRRYATAFLYAILRDDPDALPFFYGDDYALVTDPDWIDVRRRP